MTTRDKAWAPHFPISDFCETGSGGTPARSKASLYFGGSIPWVKSGELRENTINVTEETITELGLKESAAKLLPRGTLLVALYGATVGRIGVLGIEAATNQAVCYIKPDQRRANRQYLFYALQAQVPTWLSKRVGGGQPNISQAIIRDTQIPLPPLEDQIRIAHLLSKVEGLIAHKLAQDPLYYADKRRRKAFYPFSTTSPDITLTVSFTSDDWTRRSHDSVNVQVDSSTFPEETATWKELFGIEKRYAAKCCSKNGGSDWQNRIVNECLNYSLTPQAMLEAELASAANAPWVQCNFLKKAFLESLHRSGLIQ